METIVRLRRGTAPRTVAIALTVRIEAADPEAGSRAFDAFVRLIEAGRCQPARVLLLRAAMDAHPQHGLLVESWEVSFPKLDPHSFAILARMFQSSVRGARRLEIRERAPEVTLTVRRFESEGEATILDVPWRIAFVPAPAPAVRILFEQTAGARDVERLARAVRAWAEVLALGGFPGRGERLGSTGTLLGIEVSGERELVIGLCSVVCGYDAWEAFFEVLAEAGAETPIVLVEIRGGI